MVWRTCETTFGHAKNLPIVFPARKASDSKQSMTIDRTHKTGFRCTLAVNRKSDSHTIRFVLLPGSAWHGNRFMPVMTPEGYSFGLATPTSSKRASYLLISGGNVMLADQFPI